MSPERQLGLAGEALDDEAPVEVEDGEPVGERVELGVKRRARTVPSGSRSAMRWPRTRYMLMSGCTARLLDEAAVDRLAGRTGLTSWCQRAGW